MTMNDAPEYLVEAKKRMPDFLVDWNADNAHAVWQKQYDEWISLFYVQAREIAAPLQADGKRPQPRHLNAEDWDLAAQRTNAILKERQS